MAPCIVDSAYLQRPAGYLFTVSAEMERSSVRRDLVETRGCYFKCGFSDLYLARLAQLQLLVEIRQEGECGRCPCPDILPALMLASQFARTADRCAF